MTRFLEAGETAVAGRPPLSDAAEYAYAAVSPPGTTFVHVAGACPLDPDGATTPVGDVAGQAAVAMANLEQSLAAAGCGLHDVVKTTIYVASSAQPDLVAAWTVVRDTFAPHRPPGTLLGVSVLGYDDQLVEIDAVAARG
ncbi:RidA family protein [Georgenia halophila]|uniref:RidA family protein n=1 Tax=Georgenia halophila TaxID=620889 RepID=A0ABP8LDJ4_9MICO